MDLPDGYHAVPPGKLATVVTYLEMTAPPPPGSGRVPDDYRLERVERWDTDAFRALYVAIGWQWMWSSRLLLSEEELVRRLHQTGTEAYLPIRAGRPMGLLELDCADPATIEISFFGLVPDAVGSGVGRWLMEEAFRIAWGRSATRRLWVHTCHFDSPQALPFYQKMGFVPYARAVEVFDDARLIGRLDINAGPHVPLIRGNRRPDNA